MAPSRANFCPECGSPRSPDLLDPLAVSGRTDSGAGSRARRGSRLEVLLGLAALAGLVIVIWSVARGPGNGDTPVAGGSVGRATAAPAATVSTTTGPVTTTTAGPRTTTTTAPVSFLLGDEPGPVLDDAVKGTLVGFSSRRMFRIDVSTGLVDLIELERSIEIRMPGGGVVVGAELVSDDDEVPIVTDMVTGEQRELYDPEEPDSGGWSQVVGPAGPGKLWVGIQHGWGMSGSTVREFDMAGSVYRSIDLPAGFWAEGATGDLLYLSGPDGTWSYDTIGQEAEHIGGWFDPSHRSSRVVCDPTLTCRLLVDTPIGPREFPGIGQGDIWNMEYQVSPDGTQALVVRYPWFEEGNGEDGDEGDRSEPEEPRLLHVDVLTGAVTELGWIETELWNGVLWIPDSSWVIVQSNDRGPIWVALDTRTAEAVTIDPARSGDLTPLSSRSELLSLRYLPPATAP